LRVKCRFVRKAKFVQSDQMKFQMAFRSKSLLLIIEIQKRNKNYYL